MDKIVIVTTHGSLKKDFVNRLFRETDGAVKFVFIQKPKIKKFSKRVISFCKKVGLWGLPREIYYFLLIKLSKKKQEALNFRKEATLSDNTEKEYLTSTIEIDDINSDLVYKKLNEIKPDTLVIWGGQIIKSHILKTAKIALNMHFGLATHYRGSNAISNAILEKDFDHIATTIHFAVPNVDAGDIIAIIKANLSQPPKNFFRELNDKSVNKYIEIIKDILKDKKIFTESQDLKTGKTYTLKSWTYGKQNKLAKMLMRWEFVINKKRM